MKALMAILVSTSILCCGTWVLAETAKLTGAPSTTAFSGQGGAERTLSKPASANDAIVSLVTAERSDDPCFLQVSYQDVATGAAAGSLSFAQCSDNNKNQGTSQSRLTTSLPAGSFATGVRVCLNSGRDKIKGIVLLGRFGGCLLGQDKVTVKPPPCSQVIKISGHDYRVCDTGQPSFVELGCNEPSTSVTSSPVIERTNCPGSKSGPDQDWEAAASCPAQMVATGMKLSTRSSGGGRQMIDGVALECTRLEVSN